MSSTPPWLEQYRMDEALMAQAYDQVDPSARARIKTALACYFALWPPIPDKSSTGRSLNGFDLHTQDAPAPWVLALVAPGYSPARVLAALAPALLAKVSPVLVVSNGLPDSLMRTVLELAGLEEIFHTLPEAGPQCPKTLLQHLMHKAPGGRVLFLGPPPTAESEPWPGVAHLALASGIPLWQDVQAPLIHVEQDMRKGKGTPVNVINQLHPDARVLPVLAGVADPLLNVAVSFGQHSPHAEHHFAPGLEACWLHQALMPAWFRNLRLSATFNPGNLP